MSRRKVSTTVYLEPQQVQHLAQLSAQTKVPQAEYIRQGLDLLFIKLRAEGEMPWTPPET